MENKKQLIIIPPMSEAVKKLHEVLEGIAVDENMEITLIDDLKELGQFVGSAGQCLILVSNAKKCATFLQENKFFLLKNHCKTILFTPKEIPAKTLVKFTKIGLTESILESSPPKTFLYKVKLLLRSIKTAKPAEDADKTVKSLDQKAKEEAELELKEKGIQLENVIDMDRPNKKEQAEGETIDYGNPLKGKVKPTEENLDTHWKSNRKKSETPALTEDESGMEAESQPSAIDMYMRGKSKKATEALIEEDDFDKKMAELLAAEEEAKKKSNFQDIQEDGTMKEKRLPKQGDDYFEEDSKKPLVELDIEAAQTKKKPKDIEPEDGMDDFDRKMAELMAAEEERKKNDYQEEDLGGHLTGKVAFIAPKADDDFHDEKKEYDNSDIKEKKEKSIELDLLAAEKKRARKNIEASPEEDKINEGQVDHIEGNMVGDESTVDKIRTRMEGKAGSPSEINPDEEGENLFAKKKMAVLEEEEKESVDLDLNNGATKEGLKREALRSDEEEKSSREKSIELELTAADKKAKDKRENIEAEARERKASDLPIEDEEDREKKSLDKKEEATKSGRNFDPAQNIEKKSDNKTHNGQVDKIDTFYRGGEGFKKKDHDWGNLTDKKDSLDLIPGKGKRAYTNGISLEKTDLGEQTIDYRKMKEEFEMMERGESTTLLDKTSSGNNELKNDEDNGSFKVQEIDPKSLDFSINIINSIYHKETKTKQIFSMLADELVNNYHCYPIFYTYKLSDKKFTEAFNPFIEIRDNRMTEEKRALWNDFKKETAHLEKFQEKSMTTWRCPEIVNNEEVWEDVELPSWAEQELKTKRVELIFPYFDGIDRMGMAVVIFPEGLDSKSANGLLTVLEMARSLFLDTIQRYQVQPLREDRSDKVESAPIEEKKNVLSFFGGLFGKKKAG